MSNIKMDPIMENETSTAGSSKQDKSKHKKKKIKTDAQTGSQTVVGERRKFVVTTLPPTDEKETTLQNIATNAHTVHFGTRGAESQRSDVRHIFKDKAESSRASSAEREPVQKEYETFHGTSSSPRSSIFDIFRLRRKSDAKKHQSIMQNVKAALGSTSASKSTEAPEATTEEQKLSEDSKNSHRKYYHTVTGASSRKYSPITRVMDIFRKPHSETPQPVAEPSKKKNTKHGRRSSIETTSPTYHKNSYASLDPMQAKQLFREVRGLPKFDPYLSIVQISIGGRDKTRLLLNFFKYHKCYEILPKSAKVIIFDTQFYVKKTFPTLISHGIRSAPLWDESKKKLVGMITVTDFIRILLNLDADGIPVDELEKHTLHTWKRLLRSSRKPLCCVSPDQSLHEAINYLNKSRVHRLLMIDHESGDVLYILSHKRILRFLFVYLNEFPELTFFHRKIIELKIGTYDNIVFAKDDTTIKSAFQLLLEKDISALPVLDDDGALLDVYAKYEVLNLVSEKLYSDLSVCIGSVRNKKKDWEEKMQKCHSSITLYEALEIIVRTESHRLLLVDKDGKLVGIVSLSDILVYLNRIIPTEKKVSSLQELFRPLEENKVTESSKEAENEDITIDVPSLSTNDNVSKPETEPGTRKRNSASPISKDNIKDAPQETVESCIKNNKDDEELKSSPVDEIECKVANCK